MIGSPVEAGGTALHDRRTHYVELGPLWIRTRVSGLDGEGLLRACLTYHDLRRATASGLWAQSRGRIRELRSAAEILPHFDPNPAGILAGLSLAEAETIAEHAGARLPTQKELSVILEHERVFELRAALPPNVAFWTSSAYHMLDYSHIRYSLDNDRWEADGRVRLPHVRLADDRSKEGSVMRSVLEAQPARIVRHAVLPGARAIERTQTASLALTALLVMERGEDP
jgi:hypothetical protein